MKINRNKILLRLLKNITEYEDFDDALLSTLSQLKINQDKFYDIKQDLLPKGLSSLMKELNLIINQTIDKEQKPSRFKNYKINEKIMEFKKNIKTKYEIISVYSNKDIQKIKKILIQNAN